MSAHTMSMDELLHKFPKFWMLRECDVYDEELRSCRSLRGRLSQYYVQGGRQDCEHWRSSADDCRKWVGKADEDALRGLLDRESARLESRLRPHLANDVWEHRTAPPSQAEWSPPLPRQLQEQAELSKLREHVVEEERKLRVENETEEPKEPLALAKEIVASDIRLVRESCAIM